MQPSTRHTYSYTRPTGPDIVAPHLPSCTGLPQDWSAVHDRFIAYLATHAPLTKDGKVPAREELRERWRTADIARLLRERFPGLASAVSFCSFLFLFCSLGESGKGGAVKVRLADYKCLENPT